MRISDLSSDVCSSDLRDSNTVERSIRPLARNRKNALFAGSDEGGDNWAVLATPLECCKLSTINPHQWLTETITSLANGYPAKSAGDLMPWTVVARNPRLRLTKPYHPWTNGTAQTTRSTTKHA